MLAVMRAWRVAAVGLVAAIGCGDDAPPFPAPTRSSPAPAAPADQAPPRVEPAAPRIDAGTAPPPVGPAPVSYAESPDGLRKLARDLVAANRADDQAALARLLESLRLRNPEDWFEVSFGKTLGHELAVEYRAVRDDIGHLATVFELLATDGLSRVEIERFDRPGQPAATGYQAAALARMARQVPLYSVRFSSDDGTKVFHLWSFVYQDGSFRYVGKMKRSVETPPAGARDVLEYRVADAGRLPQ